MAKKVGDLPLLLSSAGKELGMLGLLLFLPFSPTIPLPLGCIPQGLGAVVDSSFHLPPFIFQHVKGPPAQLGQY